jgi:hypothetical protein
VSDADTLLPGRTTLRINKATMKKAMEYYLNDLVLQQPATVFDVEDAGDNCFDITIDEPKEAK